MLNSKTLFIPILLQLLVVGFDEVYYHNKRELLRLEQLGHALDTLTVWICFALILLVPPTSGWITLYASLSIFSCLFITKDEFEYHKFCGTGERWLHSLAFTLHPIVFIAAGFLWPALHPHTSAATSPGFIHYSGEERHFILGNTWLLFLFGAYEVLPRHFVWGFLSQPINHEKWGLTTNSNFKRTASPE